MEFELAEKNIQDQSTVSYALLIFQCHESLVNKIYVYSLTILSFTSWAFKDVRVILEMIHNLFAIAETKITIYWRQLSLSSVSR